MPPSAGVIFKELAYKRCGTTCGTLFRLSQFRAYSQVLSDQNGGDDVRRTLVHVRLRTFKNMLI